MTTVGSVLAFACTLVGIMRMRSWQIEAWRWFQRGVVASLLLVQPVSFFKRLVRRPVGPHTQPGPVAGMGYLQQQELARSDRVEMTGHLEAQRGGF